MDACYTALGMEFNNIPINFEVFCRFSNLKQYINEETREKLGLRVMGTLDTTLAGGGKVPSQVTERVEIRWKDRDSSCKAVVLPGEADVLLGALPLEEMDLMVHPKTREVVGAHGDTILSVVK